MERSNHIGTKIIGFQRFLDRAISLRQLLFVLAGIICLFPFVSASFALLLGLVFAFFVGNPIGESGQKLTDYLLQLAVVGLGFSIQAPEAIAMGKQAFPLILTAILSTLVLGLVIGKVFKSGQALSFLIAAGTAICGGSAIATVSPVIKAKQSEVTIALGAVFVLNALALFVFPFIGDLLGLSPQQFGTWCAIAIHDTSSVVGAASQFGDQALAIATTLKLARAMWIIPVALIAAVAFSKKASKVKIPYFIGLFVIAVLLNSYLPEIGMIRSYIVSLSHACMCLAIFLVGSSLSKKVLFSGGPKILLQASLLWLVIGSATLWAIIKFY
ncbi:putative sulfate exporter family transporter [Echinicola marina]|uniref:YeiH family protein n=1 Tax=Echinicola marina TaxID=2859768 RepID=UPI001CF65AE9|nr:putative sulfate exporter family transporter [Echinicola marina]UCS94650.1 putative sulfate exporter family transporter [Echinicola marina]